MADGHRQALTRSDGVLIASAGLYVACLVLSATTASKLYDIAGLGLVVTVPVGTTLFALTLPALSLVNEVWGPRHAMALVVLGLAMRVGTLLFLAFAVTVAPATGWQGQAGYAAVLGVSGSVLWAGLVAFLVSQPLGVWLFDVLRRRQAGRNLLWLRALVAAPVAYAVDSVLFVLLAFGAGGTVLAIVAGQILVKLVVAALATPLIYLGRNLATGRRLAETAG